MELDFCSCITSNLYFKVFFVFIVGLILTFAHQVEILQSKLALVVVLLVFVLMTMTHTDECGAIVLLGILFVLTYNLNTNYKKIKDDDDIKQFTQNM
jgi:hypothetical protein